jgi:hypothetical protein
MHHLTRTGSADPWLDSQPESAATHEVPPWERERSTEGLRMAAAVLARAAMFDRGATPGRRENLEALAEHLATIARELELELYGERPSVV